MSAPLPGRTSHPQRSDRSPRTGRAPYRQRRRRSRRTARRGKQSGDPWRPSWSLISPLMPMSGLRSVMVTSSRCWRETATAYREARSTSIPAKDLFRRRRHRPVGPLLVRPAVATDENVIDVRSDEKQQQVGGALKTEPRTEARLGTQKLQHLSEALGRPSLVEGHDPRRVGIAVCRHTRDEVQRGYPPGDLAHARDQVAQRLLHVLLGCPRAKPGLLVRGE